MRETAGWAQVVTSVGTAVSGVVCHLALSIMLATSSTLAAQASSGAQNFQICAH
jgi:hypothetical protein